jgi:hypothetical protein
MDESFEIESLEIESLFSMAPKIESLEIESLKYRTLENPEPSENSKPLKPKKIATGGENSTRRHRRRR